VPKEKLCTQWAVGRNMGALKNSGIYDGPANPALGGEGGGGKTWGNDVMPTSWKNRWKGGSLCSGSPTTCLCARGGRNEWEGGYLIETASRVSRKGIKLPQMTGGGSGKKTNICTWNKSSRRLQNPGTGRPKRMLARRIMKNFLKGI